MDDPWSWLVLVLFVGVGYFLNNRRRQSRDSRALAKMRSVPIARVKHGEWALVTGTLEAVGPPMTSPIGIENCVGFMLEVRYAGGDDDDSPMFTKEDGGAFSVTDDTGTMHVEGPFRIVVDSKDDWSHLEREDLDVLEEENVPTTGLIGNPSFLYRERLLRPGDLVSVLGQVFLEPDPAAPAVGFRSPALARRMRGAAGRPVLVQPAERPGRG